METKGGNCVDVAAAVFNYVKMGIWKWQLVAVTSHTIVKKSTDWPRPTTGTLQPPHNLRQLFSHGGGQFLPASTNL